MFTNRKERLEKGRREIAEHLRAQVAGERRRRRAASRPLQKALTPSTRATSPKKVRMSKRRTSGGLSQSEMVALSVGAVLSRVVKQLDGSERRELGQMLSGLDGLRASDAQRDRAALAVTTGYVLSRRGTS